MKKAKKILALLLVCVIGIAAVACGGGDNGNSSSPSGSVSPSESASQSGSASASASASSSPSTNPAGTVNTAAPEESTPPPVSARDTLSVALGSDPGTLNAVFISGDFNNIMNCIHEPLWDLDENGNVIWQLATSVDIVSDSQWLVHLREGVTFSNGNPLTASDVVWTIRYFIESGAMWGLPRTQTLDIYACAVVDDYTVDLRMKGFQIANWSVLSDLVIYDEESFDPDKASENPIGTGPYVLSEYVVNSYVLLTARDDYWGGTPSLKSIRFRILAEPSQRVNALETGLVDIATISVDDYDCVDSLPGLKIISRYPPSWHIILYNHNEASVLSNVEARYAICAAIDRQAIVNLVYQGRAQVMKYPMSTVVFDHEERFENMHSTYAIGYNVEYAKELADKTGLTGKELVIRTNGDPQYVTMAEIVQNMLLDIGVTTVIHNYDGAGFEAEGRDTTAWDIAFQGNICPNKRIVDPLINGVRYVESRQVGWEGVDRFMELGAIVFTIKDDKERSDTTWEMLELYQNACIDFALCDVQTHMAFSSDLTNITYRTTSGLRYKDLYFTS